MDILTRYSGLRNKDALARKVSWKRLREEYGDHPFSPREVNELRLLLLDEPDPDVRTTGIICLDQMLHSPTPAPEEGFHDWLFHSFRQTRGEGKQATKHSLVVTVCDDAYVRDVQALVEVARRLPSDRYSQTVFRHVALQSPDWADVGLNRAEAICFIGRPSMFKDCRIIDHFPSDLRFSIEPPDVDEPEGFFRVSQNRPKAGRLMYPTTEDSLRRHDHAIVQRFVIRMGGRDVTVVVIAGGSSVGTLGAAQWASAFEWGAARRNEFARVAGLDAIDSSTRIEAFLTVSARVHKPARPWRPEIEERGLFLHKSRNLLKVPARISVATDSGSVQNANDVRYLLFDDDEMEFGTVDYAAAVAVCVKYCIDEQPEMSIKDLVSDQRLWPKGICPVKGGACTFFRDHLQRRSFNGIIEVGASSLQLKLDNCKIAVIPAQSSASSMMVRTA
jgi:hypothetical protein